MSVSHYELARSGMTQKKKKKSKKSKKTRRGRKRKKKNTREREGQSEKTKKACTTQEKLCCDRYTSGHRDEDSSVGRSLSSSALLINCKGINPRLQKFASDQQVKDDAHAADIWGETVRLSPHISEAINAAAPT